MQIMPISLVQHSRNQRKHQFNNIKYLIIDYNRTTNNLAVIAIAISATDETRIEHGFFSPHWVKDLPVAVTNVLSRKRPISLVVDGISRAIARFPEQGRAIV